MRKVGILKAIAFVHKADKMSDRERLALQQLRLKELTAYVKKNSPYFAGLYHHQCFFCHYGHDRVQMTGA